MYLGKRKIRSAGRNSGSIEVTLPARLRLMEEVECRFIVRDGPRPEIVLQPDLSAAQSLFCELWERLRLGLDGVGEIDEFSPAHFALALFLPPHWDERPPLAYADALAVLRKQAGGEEHRPEAMTRVLAFMGVAAGRQLGLEGSLAIAFGDAVAYLMTGIPAGLGTDFERGMAHRICWGDGRAQQPLGSPLDSNVWRQARSGLRGVYDQFCAWQEDPKVYSADRGKWYRALTVEMGMHISSVEDHTGS